MRIQVLGLCRFSMLVENAFQSVGSDLNQSRGFLYDPRRLEQRMRWFEHLCLQPLLWQTDPDFTLILATGIDLPQPWLARLTEIAGAVPQIRLEQVAPGKHGQICRQLLAKHTDPDADVVAQFRMDDDDAVALDYVAQLRQDFRLIRPLMKADAPVALDYTQGLVIERQGDGSFDIRAEHARLWVPALAMYFPADRPGSIMNYRHDWIWRLATMVSRNHPLMWIRGFHGKNDSPRTHYRPMQIEMAKEQIDQTLRRRFGLDRELLVETLAQD
ncbi:glycosyltransferase [Paracoccus sp. (in: a-proteobacteria)]|uniref:glycosyltransferase n=1 Tax=Paracoccus sp. TaxID=267 RepID=UPI003A8468D1